MSSLCSNCKHMFRITFTDRDVDKNEILIGKTCLISEWDIGSMEVYECNKYESVEYQIFDNIKGMLR